MKNEIKPVGDLTIVCNHKIHIYKSGDAGNPVLVFLAGSGTVAPVYDFKVLYEKLSDNFRIVVIEKFGYGYSDIYEADCHIDSLVSIERQALENTGEKGPFILVPHSMGGLEAIRWKQKYPDEVKAIIGIDMATPLTYNSWTAEDVEKRTRLMKTAAKFRLASILCQINNRTLTHEEIKQHKLLRKRNAFNICYINEADEVLSNSRIVSSDGYIKCPALLFSSNGKQTSEHWVENKSDFASILGAELVCFDCGHYIHHYKSAEMSEMIIKFVKNNFS